MLARYKNARNLSVFGAALKSESYTVQAAGLFGIYQNDEKKAIREAHAFERDNEGELTEALFVLYAKKADVKDWPYIYKRYTEGTLQDKIHLLNKFATMVTEVNDTNASQQGIQVLTNIGIEYKSKGAAPYVIKLLDQIRDAKKRQNDEASVKTADDGEKEINEAK